MSKEFMIKEVAENLGVTQQAVSNYLRTGKLIGYKVGSRWRIPSQSIIEFLEKSNNKFIGGNE